MCNMSYPYFKVGLLLCLGRGGSTIYIPVQQAHGLQYTCTTGSWAPIHLYNRLMGSNTPVQQAHGLQYTRNNRLMGSNTPVQQARGLPWATNDRPWYNIHVHVHCTLWNLIALICIPTTVHVHVQYICNT